MARSPAATLGERANADLKRTIDGPAYQRCFYGTQIPATAKLHQSSAISAIRR